MTNLKNSSCVFQNATRVLQMYFPFIPITDRNGIYFSSSRYSHIFNQKGDGGQKNIGGILFDLTPNSQSYHNTKYMKDSAEN